MNECVDGAASSWYDCEGEVTFEPDPFAEEINGDDTPVWMCEHHRHESAMDIGC